MMKSSGGFCKFCGNWIDSDERCDCHAISGYHWGGGDAEEANDWAVRCMEDALSLVDDDYWTMAA